MSELDAIIDSQPEPVLRGHYGAGMPFEASCRALRKAMENGGYVCINAGRALFTLISDCERLFLEAHPE
jgi:hypothetical protein